ncbi:hypothetical protein LEP1GSC052_2890 [Leptospira kmetyi serovar Malaysia str. Bejo-Iso9]|nr:hypothetical protein LEP1GSC052_2890 [Leptospira kmetyi serovar Malaysia str. Bejo-Iso9]
MRTFKNQKIPVLGAKAERAKKFHGVCNENPQFRDGVSTFYKALRKKI